MGITVGIISGFSGLPYTEEEVEKQQDGVTAD